MDIQKLLSLREDVFQGIVPLLDVSDLDPIEKFDIYTQLANTRNDYALLEKAFHVAQTIDDAPEKLQAYLGLLGDIDVGIQDANVHTAISSELLESADTTTPRSDV